MKRLCQLIVSPFILLGCVVWLSGHWLLWYFKPYSKEVQSVDDLRS